MCTKHVGEDIGVHICFWGEKINWKMMNSERNFVNNSCPVCIYSMFCLVFLNNKRNQSEYLLKITAVLSLTGSEYLRMFIFLWMPYT